MTNINKEDLAKIVAAYDVKEEFLEDLNEKGKEFIDKIDHKDLDDLKDFIKICLYKIYANELNVDCDVSKWTMDIFAKLYGKDWKVVQIDKSYKYQLKNQTGTGPSVLSGDTMNSYATTVRKYIRKTVINPNKDEMIDKEILEANNGSWLINKTYRDISSKFYFDVAIVDNLGYFIKKLKDNKEIYNHLSNFIKVNHTIGNFLPIPNGFNVPRNSALKDYWDLTLLHIYNYFKCETPISFITDFEASDTKKWLDSFKNHDNTQEDKLIAWNNFVDKNYMQSFVHKKNGDKVYGMPKELWEGHFDVKGKVLPTKTDEYKQFFKNASEWITARGEKMINDLDVKDIEKLVDEIYAKSEKSNG